MKNVVDFQEVLLWAETRGWKLKKIRGNHRVFVKAGFYFCFPIHARKVRIEYVEKFKQYNSEIG
jgi:predicted RNA binding protein YcfA (HicA-like mRNA interferase family)